MTPTICQSVLCINFGREIWIDLQHDKGDAYKLSGLLEAFYSKKQGSLSIDEYYTNFKIMWDEIILILVGVFINFIIKLRKFPDNIHFNQTPLSLLSFSLKASLAFKED